MAFKQAYSNTKNILADFITSLCYEQSDDNLQENWQLIYPKQQDLLDFLDYLSEKEDIDEEDEKFLSYTPLDIKDNMQKRRDLVFRWIVEYRRSTISCMYIPDLQWERSERVAITQEMLDEDTNEKLFIKLKKPLDTDASVGVYLQDKKIWFYQNNDLDTLANVEFYPDYENNGLIINKANISFRGTDVVYLNINYQTYGEDPMTWYVDFEYPETIDGKRKNYHYFEWTFGKEIDDNYHIVNRKKSPVVLRGCWHTTAVLDKNTENQDLSWLPIEYFMSWDLNSVSFIMCEDPIIDVDSVIHSFNYIGVLDGIKDADYDDIEGNFGACGSYDINVHSTQGMPSSKSLVLERANITFVKKMYNSYFNLTEAEVLLQLKNVNAGNYTVADEMINELPNFDSSNLQISDGQTAVTKTLQLKAGDAARPCPLTYNPLSTDSESKSLGPVANSVTKRYNIFKRNGKKATISMPLGNDFQINVGTVASPVYVAAKLQSNDNKFSMVNGQPVTLTTINEDIYLARDTNVIDSKGLAVTLDGGTNILLQFNLTIPYTDNEPLKLPAGTVVVDAKFKEAYTLTTASFISVPKVLIESTTPIDLTIVKETEFDIENTVPIGSVVKLVSSYVEVTFDIVTDYIVEFHYKTPFIGEIKYYFPSIWFDNLNVSNGSRTGSLTNTTSGVHDFGYLANETGSWQGGTTSIVPIAEEPMHRDPITNEIDSIYNHVIEIDDEISDILIEKNDIMIPISVNQYHKVKTTTPDIITNTTTGESWRLQNSSAKAGSTLIQTNDSITNVISYPRQIYTNDFRYKKRTGNKATIMLGAQDVTKLGVFLTDSGNNILVPKTGTQVYRNLTITRNTDNGITLEVDTSNPNSESVYIGINRYSPYFSQASLTGGYYGRQYLVVQFLPILLDILYNYAPSYSENIVKMINTSLTQTVENRGYYNYNASFTNTYAPYEEVSYYTLIPFSSGISNPSVGSNISNRRILKINLGNPDTIFEPMNLFNTTTNLKYKWQ